MDTIKREHKIPKGKRKELANKKDKRDREDKGGGKGREADYMCRKEKEIWN